MHPYLTQAIFSWISIIIVFVLTFIVTKSITNDSSWKLLLSLIISTWIAVILTTVFDAQIQNFITVKCGLENYTLWKTVIEWLIITIIWLILLRWYFSKSILWLWLILIFYFITVYWITPALYKFYDFIMYMIEKFL